MWSPKASQGSAPEVPGAVRVLAGLVCALIALALLAACQTAPARAAPQAEAAAAFARGPGHFTFADWAGPPVNVWTYAPETGDLAALPVVVVMHGVDRDGDRYRDEWIAAARTHNLIVLAPSFSDAAFPKAAGYNIGNVFDDKTGARNAKADWSFSAIDPIFEAAVKRLGGKQASYTLYGHSAGAQFVHRYLYFMATTRADLFIVANAGWYTMPDFGQAFPYGLGDSTLDRLSLDRALGRKVTVLLGDRDTDAADPNLRRTPEALAQGPHRFARGHAFFEAAQSEAAKAGVDFEWRQVDVPGAHHSNGLMAPAAAALISEQTTGR